MTPTSNSTPPIILASSSPYRAQILRQVGLPFTAHSPDINETPKPNEPPHALVTRLAREKARALAPAHPNALIIGADQVAAHPNGEILGKPHSHQHAIHQLQTASAATITLYSGIALYHAPRNQIQSAVERYRVQMHPLTPDQINRYLKTEKPYDACGSLKTEGPGIALIKSLRGNDPNALLGLPLLRLLQMLRKYDIHLI